MFRYLGACFILVFAYAGTALAVERVEGVSFPEEYTRSSVDMSLRGVALKRYWFFKAFVAGLYLPAAIDSREVLEDVPKRLDVYYFVAISKDKLTHYTIDVMRENVSDQDMASMREQLDSMGRYFVDLQPGDRYALEYDPAQGTRFIYNGELVGVIPGKDFARSLFSVWMGDSPMDVNVKKAILGESAS